MSVHTQDLPARSRTRETLETALIEGLKLLFRKMPTASSPIVATVAIFPALLDDCRMAGVVNLLDHIWFTQPLPVALLHGFTV